MNSLMWMRREWPCNGWCVVMWGTRCGDTRSDDSEVKKITEVGTKLQKRISGDTGDK